MSTVMKPDIWDSWAYGPGAEEPTEQEPTFRPDPGKGTVLTENKWSQSDSRHSRRRPIRSNAEIVDWHCVQVRPDITRVVDASPDGILFESDRKYRMGMELLVRFPFPCASSPKQRGTVVRIEEQPDGNSRVAVRFG